MDDRGRCPCQRWQDDVLMLFWGGQISHVYFHLTLYISWVGFLYRRGVTGARNTWPRNTIMIPVVGVRNSFKSIFHSYQKLQASVIRLS